MMGNDLQIPDTDFYDRSCCNLRHEARVVNQTRLRFTTDMHSLYLWVLSPIIELPDVSWFWYCETNHIDLS